MVATRLDSQAENTFTGAISDLERAINELKTGVQYVEPKLYDLQTTNTYDIFGNWAISTTGTVTMQLVITVQSTDSTPLLATFTPAIYLGSNSSTYIDTLTSPYGITQNIQVSDDPTKISYFISFFSRGTTGTVSYWLKSYCWATSPATMSIARTI